MRKSSDRAVIWTCLVQTLLPETFSWYHAVRCGLRHPVEWMGRHNYLHFCLILVASKECCSPLGSTRIESVAMAIADFQDTLKGVQGRDQEWGVLCSGKTGRIGLQMIFLRENFMNPNFFHLSILRKALKPVNWDVCSLWLATFYCVPLMAQLQCHRHADIPSLHPTSLEQFFRALWEAISLYSVSLQIRQKLTGTLCIIISVDRFGDHEETQTRLFFPWTLWGSRALGTSKTSRVSCVCLHPRRVQMNLSRPFLVLTSPAYWLMILSFIWQYIIDSCPPLPHLPRVGRLWGSGSLVERDWKNLDWLIRWEVGLDSPRRSLHFFPGALRCKDFIRYLRN